MGEKGGIDKSENKHEGTRCRKRIEKRGRSEK